MACRGLSGSGGATRREEIDVSLRTTIELAARIALALQHVGLARAEGPLHYWMSYRMPHDMP
ncbi:MAG: hypothetical protein H0T89_17940 [Deltaproteobacteria bacterium]|nr:hypothetical protein [Deltaproteobacteria bacterium]MDQ3298136.1 hypothetical protein [Myxococcota bacterium]